MHFNQTLSSLLPQSSENDNTSTNCFSLSVNLRQKRDVTLCHTLYPVAIEARPAVAAVSAGVVLTVSKLGALISVVGTRPKVV